MKKTRYLSVQEVIAINIALIQRNSPEEQCQQTNRFYGSSDIPAL
jgi:hypothetical protein